jgi:hypothetical protein
MMRMIGQENPRICLPSTNARTSYLLLPSLKTQKEAFSTPTFLNYELRKYYMPQVTEAGECTFDSVKCDHNI